MPTNLKKNMKEFSKEINKLAQKHNITQLFDDFMDISICVFSLGKMEEKYNEVTAKYLPDELQILKESFAQLILAYQKIENIEGCNDILGDFFMSTNSYNSASNKGQFFTPVQVCNFMSASLPSQHSNRISDLCSGSGRNLIAHANIDRENRQNCFYVGSDLDKRCVKMTALNMFLFGMNGVSIHMDGIFLDIYSGYRIYPHHTLKGIQLLTKEECVPYLLTRT